MLEIKSLTIRPKKIISLVILITFIVSTTFTFDVRAGSDKIIFPIKEISKLKCRFNDFDTLKSDCKRTIPILKTKDYTKYVTQNWGYNEYTRIYTVLWWASYKYGWDVGQGWHSWLDIATAKGTPVYNIADWIVIVSKNDPSWWKVVSVKHKIRWKEIISNYSHLSKINVKKWQKINVWTKIWEVGNTGNSTGNHLHFQIDLANKFHPYYYNWKKCPYSYYKITETGVCYNELTTNTLDPIEFLETNWAILDNITISNSKQNIQKINKKTISNSSYKANIIKWVDMDIFNKTIHTDMWSSKSDVIKIQQIYKNLWYYEGSIDWNYSKLENSIIKYQLSNWVIKNKYENWAGWFWPKTRAHTKFSYIKYLNTSNSEKRAGKKVYISNTKDKKSVVTVKRKKYKIERKNILTREEIEEREINDFLKNHKINLKLNKIWWNIKIWENLNIELSIDKIINRKKTREFKWVLPAWITFELDENKASIFPKKIKSLSNWKRNIILKGIKSGNTVLKIKLWNKVIKTINLKVFWNISKIFPQKVDIIANSNLKLWETKTAMGIFKDSWNKKLINIAFNWTFILQTWNYSKVCIKRWTLKNIKNIYNTKCDNSEFVQNPEISYKDTVNWILVFDYKTTVNKYSVIKIIGKNSWKIYDTKKILVSIPKGLNKKYNYYNETISMLEKGIVSGIQKWYFMEDRELTKRDALSWIENTLLKIQSKSTNWDTKAQINKKLVEIKKDKDINNHTKITRKDFLRKAYKYLIVNDTNIEISINYKDLQSFENKKINTIFDKENTWKDRFGKTHFQPNKKITRWEWAFLLSKALNKTTKLYLTLK